MSSKDNVFYRYIWVDETQVTPAISFLGGLQAPQAGQNFALGWTRILSPSLVNSYHMGYNRSVNFNTPEGSGSGKLITPQMFSACKTFHSILLTLDYRLRISWVLSYRISIDHRRRHSAALPVHRYS